MGNCGSNTLTISRPSQNAGGCASTSELGPTDPTYIGKLGPRKLREKVREQMKDYVLLMLGAPVVRIELDAQQLDLAVDEALMIFEDYCPREYFQYYTFDTTPGKSVYEMPPDVGLIRNVSYKQQGNYAFTASDLGGSIPIEYFNPGGAYAGQSGLLSPTSPIWGNMGEWVLYKQYENMFSRLSSNIGGWEWVGGLNHIKLYPVPYGRHRVIVHYLQKRPDFREVTQAMQEGALAFAKIMLGRIRSKIKNPPGPNGGVQLDGLELLAEGKEDKEKWEERLINRFGDILPITMG